MIVYVSHMCNSYEYFLTTEGCSNLLPKQLINFYTRINLNIGQCVLYPGKRISLYIGFNTCDQTNTHSYTPERPRIDVFILFYSPD